MAPRQIPSKIWGLAQPDPRATPSPSASWLARASSTSAARQRPWRRTRPPQGPPLPPAGRAPGPTPAGAPALGPAAGPGPVALWRPVAVALWRLRGHDSLGRSKQNIRFTSQNQYLFLTVQIWPWSCGSLVVALWQWPCGCAPALSRLCRLCPTASANSLLVYAKRRFCSKARFSSRRNA